MSGTLPIPPRELDPLLPKESLGSTSPKIRTNPVAAKILIINYDHQGFWKQRFFFVILLRTLLVEPKLKRQLIPLLHQPIHTR